MQNISSLENSDRILIGFVRLKNCKMLINMKFLDKSKLAQQPTTHCRLTFLLARGRFMELENARKMELRERWNWKMREISNETYAKMHDYII